LKRYDWWQQTSGMTRREGQRYLLSRCKLAGRTVGGLGLNVLVDELDLQKGLRQTFAGVEELGEGVEKYWMMEQQAE
jgi:hypothetical protein